jgi:hypothetical protein
MDLSAYTMLYALTDREKPVYVNQPPLHLSGEYTQIAFVSQIERYGEKCAFALIAFGENAWMLDGIDNSLRYYKLYEYLNENFKPLCCDAEKSYSLWVRKDRYDEAYLKLQNNAEFQAIDYSHYNHNYYAGYIPFLWGEYDSKKAYNNAVVREINSFGEIITKTEQARENYVLAQIEASQDDVAGIEFADVDGNVLAQFSFAVKAGTHRYLIRPSVDSYWRQVDLKIQWSTYSESEIKRIALLVGD